MNNILIYFIQFKKEIYMYSIQQNKGFLKAQYFTSFMINGYDKQSRLHGIHIITYDILILSYLLNKDYWNHADEYADYLKSLSVNFVL